MCGSVENSGYRDLTSILLKLASIIEEQHRERAVSLYERAVKLLPDNDPNKSMIVLKIATLQSQLRSVEPTRPAPSTVTVKGPRNKPPATGKHGGANTSNSPNSPKEAAPTKSEIESWRRAASLAEQAQRKDAWKYRMKLAQVEAQAGKDNDAINDAKTAISIYPKPDDAVEFPDGLLPDFYAETLIGYLTSHGHVTEAESLYIEATKRIELLFGKTSAALANQLWHYAKFQLNRERDSEGFNALDQLLQIDLRTSEIDPYEGHSAINQYLSYASTIGPKHASRTRMMLQKLLLKQKQTFHPDDERIATTLRMLATSAHDRGQDKEAEQLLWESVAINKLYAGDVMAIQQLNGIISEILKGEGRENEAKLVAVPKIGWVAPELLRKIGRTKEADQIEHDGDVPDYIDPNQIEIHNLRPTDPSNGDHHATERTARETCACAVRKRS